ncbi:ABC transporter ATP-binding protein [Streptomyces sp. NPDC020719]|uniref:ABC transporter ATP-binding protein n=1 Tax=Streptomyces sp. NPDC020719 TaxID=3154896 RepID=UPI0033DA85F7
MEAGAMPTAPPRGTALGLARLAPAGTAVSLVCATVAIGTSLLFPSLLARAVDRTLVGATPAGTLVLLTAMLLLRVLAEAGSGLARTSVMTRVAASLRYRLLRQVFDLGLPGLRRYPAGDLVSRMTGNAATSSGAVPVLVEMLVVSAVSLAGLSALSLIDWRLGVVFLAGALPSAWLLWRKTNNSYRCYERYAELQGTIAARLADALAGRRTIRASGTAAREVTRILDPLRALARCGMENWAILRTVAWRAELALTGIRVAVLLVAGLGVADGRMSAGEFLAASMYLTFALGFLDQVHHVVYLREVQASTNRVAEVLAAEPQVRTGCSGTLPPGPGALSFRQVTVRLQGRLVLDGLDLVVPAGTAVALVGRSGAGKTSLALLAARLIDPDRGSVVIDGMDTALVDPVHLRREIAYAFDRPVLLGRTIREALTYGRPETPSAQVEYAARVAEADAFIRRLPQGFDTTLDDTTFSGGELQRLGLARAVAHGRRILVLDDAMSSLDTATEAKVAEALTEHLAGRTRLLVAHRATTAARADLVAWLDGGRIRACAPHDVLWAGDADYRAVFA